MGREKVYRKFHLLQSLTCISKLLIKYAVFSFQAILTSISFAIRFKNNIIFKFFFVYYLGCMLLRFFVSTLLKSSALIKHKILQLLVEFPNFCFVLWNLQCKMISFGSNFRRILRRNGRLLRGRRVGDGHFDDVMRKVVAILDQLFHVVDQDDIQVVLLLRIQPAGIVKVRWPDAFGIVSHLLKKRIGMYFFNS